MNLKKKKSKTQIYVVCMRYMKEKNIQLRISCSKSMLSNQILENKLMLSNQILENKLRFTFNTQDEVAAKCELP